jgi:hypothetical protein
MLYDSARDYETTARREYAENMEVLAKQATEANERVVAAMEKMYDRFVARRTH